MPQQSMLRKTLMLSSFFVAAMGYDAGPAAAQSIFCPTTGVIVPGTVVAGNCTFTGTATNGGVGTAAGFTVAALASEGLNDIVQASTTTSLSAVRERRLQEAEQCPEGFERAAGECRRITQPQAPAARPITVTRTRPAAPAAAPRPEGYVKAPPVPYVAPGPTFAIWSQGFVDYERRSNLSPGAFETVGFVNPGGPGTPILSAVDLTRTTTTVGGLAGADVTFRSVFGSGDGLIVGVLGGYQRANIGFSGMQMATVSAQVEGPSIGAYFTYFNGGFSTDFTFKADLFTLDESATQNFAFDIGGGGMAAFTTDTSVRMTNYNVGGNVNYRFDFAGPLFNWVEPTAGFRYTHTAYGDGAAALGLADGDILRLQGGARFGTDVMWGTVRVTPSVTGLIYSNVIVDGLVTQELTTLPVGLVASDEGKIRGEGLFTLAFDYGNGLSSFVQGEVRGGQDLIGGGGRAGLRFTW
jgi:hypothetical protein